MSDMYNLRIIAADRVFYEGPCLSLIVPACDGEKEVLAHHESMVIAVTDGEMRYKTEDGTWHIGYVGRGFVQIANNLVILLTESAEKPEEIDVRRAEEAKERALEQLRQKQSIQEYYHSSASLARAMARLKTSRQTAGKIRI